MTEQASLREARTFLSTLWLCFLRAAVNPTQWYFFFIAITPHPMKKGCVATIN